MQTDVFIYIDIAGKQEPVGRLWSRVRNARESASFEYDSRWLNSKNRFALEPALTLHPGPFHTTAGKPIFGALGDSAPDRWGRMLMRRAERKRAHDQKETPRTLMEIDYLLMVDDEARQGALRFAHSENGPYLTQSETSRIPPLIKLPQLLSATEHFINEADNEDDLRLLLAPGSSLGGARPKASVINKNGQLAIAKFPHKEDEFNSVLWEAVALTLAKKAGITTPTWKIEKVLNKPVLVLDRFDRKNQYRIPFLSAMSMLSAHDHETRSYMEIADALRQHGASPKPDMEEIWRRMVFSILISNTDDHLRNHGFLFNGPPGWTLSPAYDLNPVPLEIKPRVHSTAIDQDNTTASIALAISVATYFELSDKRAREIVAQAAGAIRTWRNIANRMGITKTEQDRMATAFEHDDLKTALSFLK